MTYTPSIGDRLICNKGIFDHVGVLVAPHRVLHNSFSRGEHISCLDEFSDGQPITFERTNANPAHVMQRAQEVMANPQPYNPFFRNCEHTAWRVICGIAKSPQLYFWLAVVGIVGLIIYLGTRD